MINQTVGLVVVVALLVYVVVIYNGLVTIKNGVRRAWSNIDVLLKQRHDEIPKLVAVCSAYMHFERDTLERVMAARAGANVAREKRDVPGVSAAEGALRAGVGRIAATVETYPELKANQSIQQLLSRITGLENAITDRRELYNEYVLTNNVRIERFPDAMVANLFGFRSAHLMHFSPDEVADVDVRALMRG